MHCHSTRRPAAPAISLKIAGIVPCLFASPLALASDFSGVISMMFGIPALLLLNVALGMMLIAEPTRMVRFWAGFLGFPTLAVGFLLWGDAASLFRTDSGTLFGVMYFVLYAIGVVLLVRHFVRREAPEAREGGAGN